MVLLDTEYVRAVVHTVGTRARRGVASKVRALKLAHSQARLRSYSQCCERAAYIDGRCEFYPSLSIPWASEGTTNDGFKDTVWESRSPLSRLNSETDESAKTELRSLMMRDHELKTSSEAELQRLMMWQEFRSAGVDVNTCSPGYGYGIEARIEPIPLITERRSSCPSFGTQLYNQPIYEGDEDPLGLGIAPSVPTSSTTVLAKNGLDGIDLLYKGVPAPQHTGLVGGANGDFVANWPQTHTQAQTAPQKPMGFGPLDKLQKQFEDVKLISTSSGESTPTARSKADEWLDDVLRVSMSMSPTSPTSTVSPPGAAAYSTLPKSGPPPAHAPPPLPVRQAVSNGDPSIYQQQNSTRNSPAGINWNASPNPIQMQPIAPKAVDPFDVQWSRLEVNNAKAI
ncbi:hypothetical protein L5515_009841 [Caenorhabditis briggsae]|uniref:Uncharacterized protein n=1 Tax=Caenorhabditis briggsae TaxID=6238 RepID=A0AAE9JMU1_CAEBR|nr:hypothetical protein L5515_009841 [Caenorhabditis briggsae]